LPARRTPARSGRSRWAPPVRSITSCRQPTPWPISAASCVAFSTVSTAPPSPFSRPPARTSSSPSRPIPRVCCASRWRRPHPQAAA